MCTVDKYGERGTLLVVANRQVVVFTLRDMNLNTQKILPSAHNVYLCVLYGPENKQRLFPYTALTDWFL
jgi:hypothetical protein